MIQLARFESFSREDHCLRYEGVSDRFQTRSQVLARPGPAALHATALWRQCHCSVPARYLLYETIGGEEEVNDTERRKNNVIIYKAKEIESEVADDRKVGDMLFVHELCNDVLKIDVKSGDIEKMFRLGRREEGKDRPLLVRFAGLDKKQEVLARVKDLKTSSERFKRISTSHDLTPRQRETVKVIRKNALDKLEEEIRSGSGDDRNVGNFKIIVVGQQTNKPRAIRVPVKEQM